MENKTYSTPKVEVVKMSKQDVITTSPVITPPHVITPSQSSPDEQY